MFLIVGLGNPGKKYEKTRHNVGFMVLDAIASNFQFPIFNFQSKFNAQISKGLTDNQKVVLAKPQVFMNNSGRAVKSLYTKYKIQDTKYIVVVHDDINIPLGKIKVSQGRGSAGHKGVESIIQSLGTKNFTRIRIGIQPAIGKPKNVEGFVLQPFKKSERPLLQTAIQDAIESLSSLLEK